ncbi:Crp/Fnr family transcriptional regulator [Pseudomonas huanghezhanensis]|uniref:Crp/Fnr family transcriptional regulator n=1 Tax=Pseudomonas huanghezhanensis TaxID=3002903 RepID=UPI002285E45B|nr:Crp/Fnr family transcriptional regulator [Pseudomonas sp. BSw22131]
MYLNVRPEDNYLLATLPTADFDRVLPNLELVTLEAGQVMAEPGQPISYAYFPTTAIISMIYMMENGDSAEVAVVGRDGVVGISLFLGGGKTSSSTVVQNAGQAYRLSSRNLALEFDRHSAMMRTLLRFTQATVAQMTQIAVCNLHHRLEQQLCRWLLVRVDLVPSELLTITHELIGKMLGVRREGVSIEASKLQAGGLIRYKRGLVQVVDRAGLERLVCECFGAVKDEYARLLPRITNDMHKPKHPSNLNSTTSITTAEINPLNLEQ